MSKSRSRVKSRSRGGPLRNLFKTVTRTAGKLITSVTLAASSASRFVLNPGTSGFGTHLNTLSTIFGKYRFTKVLFRIHPIAGAAGAAIAYLPDPVTNNPTSLIEMSQVMSCQLLTNSRVDPVTVRLGPAHLLSSGDTKWWQLQDAASDSELTTQGVLHILNLGSAEYTYPIELDYVCEFCGPRGTAVYAPMPLPDEDETKDEQNPQPHNRVRTLVSACDTAQQTASKLMGTTLAQCLREVLDAERPLK